MEQQSGVLGGILGNGVPVAVSISIENKEALKLVAVCAAAALVCAVIVFGLKKAFFNG